MPLPSSETRLVPPAAHVPNDGPVLECALPGSDVPDQSLRICARRRYFVSREVVFAAWTRRAAWDSWMRLRARSRTSLAPYRGGAFRLELAEGPAIHVITGLVRDVRATDHLSLSWMHHTMSEQPSTVDVSFRDRDGYSELSIVHGQIASRREAAWLMRLWKTVLRRLGDYLEEGAVVPERLPDVAAVIPTGAEPDRRAARAGVRFARSAGIAFLFAVIALGSGRAQAARTAAVPTDSAQAAAHFAAGRWSEAAQAYSALTRADTASVVNWYRYGVSLEEIGRFRDAVDALRHATRAQAPLVNQVHYRRAKAYAGLGARDSSIIALDAAAGGGYRAWETVKADADFAAIQRDARFTSALRHIENNRFPCRGSAEHRQLDFWVGDWSVMNGTTLLGNNRIERVNGDCMLQENWAPNGGGGGGKSWSYYDAALQKWKQLFIFDNGSVMEFTGEFRDGAMRMEAVAPASANSPSVITRMTFTPGKEGLSQLFVQSTDGGKTWSTGFSGTYVRRPGTAR